MGATCCRAEAALRTAARAVRPGRFQTEAAIQSLHAQSRMTGERLHGPLAQLYDVLARFAPTTGVLVARAVALADNGEADAALSQLDAITGAETYQPWWASRARGVVRRRPARGILQGAAGRRGLGQVDHARQLVGEWREPRQCLPRQPRRPGPPRLWRHAVGLRGGAGDPGDEGARAARHLLSVHPDGRAARQHAAEPVFRQRRRDRPARVPLAGADHLFACGGFRGDRGQDRHGRQRRSRRCSARPRPPASASRVSRFRGPGRPATGACAAWCCTTPISARRRAGSMPS